MQFARKLQSPFNRATTLVVLLALTLTACGDSDSSTSGVSGGTNPALPGTDHLSHESEQNHPDTQTSSETRATHHAIPPAEQPQVSILDPALINPDLRPAQTLQSTALEANDSGDDDPEDPNTVTPAEPTPTDASPLLLSPTTRAPAEIAIAPLPAEQSEARPAEEPQISTPVVVTLSPVPMDPTPPVEPSSAIHPSVSFQGDFIPQFTQYAAPLEIKRLPITCHVSLLNSSLNVITSTTTSHSVTVPQIERAGLTLGNIRYYSNHESMSQETLRLNAQRHCTRTVGEKFWSSPRSQRRLIYATAAMKLQTVHLSTIHSFISGALSCKLGQNQTPTENLATSMTIQSFIDFTPELSASPREAGLLCHILFGGQLVQVQ